MDTRRMAVDEAIESAIALLESVVAGASPGLLSGSRFLARVPRIERLGRLVDGFRVSHAADAAQRMMSPVDTLGGAGYASPEAAIAQLAGVSEAEASGRIRLGERIATGISLTGEPVDARYPAIAAAVTAGHLGIEAAEVIGRALDAVRHRVDVGVVHEAERGIVDLAAGTEEHPPLSTDLVRIQVSTYILAIDPDGARPTEQRARISRRLTFGRETVEGMIPVTGMLTGEVGAAFKRLVDAHVRSARAVSFSDDQATSCEQATSREQAAAVRREAADDRTPQQRRHDALADVLSAATRVANAPEIAGSAPAVIVTVTAEALVSGRGVAYVDGHTTPISIDAVERLVDARGLQLVTMNPRGRIPALGSVQRCSTASQRRAIIARDGGCVIPGCTTAAGWCEVHHVIPWRDGGKTHTDNGVLLCWGHHQKIDSGPWRLSMPDGVPHIRGPGHPEWTPAGRSRVRTSFPRTG